MRACLLVAGALYASANATAMPIVNGSPSTSTPAVVALLRGSEVWCSGTLVAPRIVLTAAHCLDVPVSAVSFGDTAGARSIAVERQVSYPYFAPATGGGDIGVLVLSEPSDTTPMRLGADPVAIGAALRLVGFGATSPADSGDRTKREGTVRVDALEETRLRVSPDPAQACFGDSGGPAIVTIAGTPYVVGVVSRGDRTCAGHLHLTRTDAFLAAFLAAFVDSDGTRCARDEDCESSTCGDGVCVPAPAHDGSHCQFDPECASGYCARTASVGATCSRPCLPSLPASCADAEACVPDEDEPDAFACEERATTSSCSSTGAESSALCCVLLFLLLPRRQPTRGNLQWHRRTNPF